MDEYTAARTAARAHAGEKLEHFYDRVADDTNAWRTSGENETAMRAMVSRRMSDRALLSNRGVRQTAQFELIDALLDEHRCDPLKRRYWVTIAWDLGVTWEREPSFNVMALCNVAQHHLRRSGLDGIGLVEFDVWRNMTGEPGRRLVAQVHFVGWPVSPRTFNYRNTEAEMCRRRGLTNSLGAPSVVIKPVRGRPTDMAHLGMYMLKAPTSAKNPVPRPGRHKLWSSELPRGSAARLVEIFSHLEIGDVMFAIGAGTIISRKVMSKVQEAIAPKAGRHPAPMPNAVRSTWGDIRSVNGSRRFREPVIVTRGTFRSTPKK